MVLLQSHTSRVRILELSTRCGEFGFVLLGDVSCRARRICNLSTQLGALVLGASRVRLRLSAHTFQHNFVMLHRPDEQRGGLHLSGPYRCVESLGRLRIQRRDVGGVSGGVGAPHPVDMRRMVFLTLHSPCFRSLSFGTHRRLDPRDRLRLELSRENRQRRLRLTA